MVGGCNASFASQGGLARHVPTHFSQQNSSKVASQPKAKEESPSKAGMNKRRKLKNKRRRSLRKCSTQVLGRFGVKVPPHSGGFSADFNLVGLAFLVMGRKQFQILFVFLFRVNLCASRKKDQFSVSNNWSCQLKEAFYFRVGFCLLTLLLLERVLFCANEI